MQPRLSRELRCAFHQEDLTGIYRPLHQNASKYTCHQHSELSPEQVVSCPPRKCLNNLFLSEDKAKQRQETLYSHNVQIDGTDRSYVNNLAFHLKELEKLEQPKSQGGGRKGTIRLEQKFKRTMQMIMIKSWFFERHFNMLFAGK